MKVGVKPFQMPREPSSAMRVLRPVDRPVYFAGFTLRSFQFGNVQQ
jgi:hypothetical protein